MPSNQLRIELMDVRSLKRKRSSDDDITETTDQKKSESFLVNIKDLPKEQVLLSLFNNVYKKSVASNRTFRTLADLYYFNSDTRIPIGAYEPPTKHEAADILNKNPRVDYVGAVMFKIDFSTDEINTMEYDNIHQTGTPQIKSAYDCINELRTTLELERKKRTEEKAKEKQANEQISKILEHKNCRISTLPFLGITVYFKPEVSYEKSLEHARKLTEIGLSVKVEKDTGLLRNLITPLGELWLLDPIDTIYEKLSMYRPKLDVDSPKKDPS